MLLKLLVSVQWLVCQSPSYFTVSEWWSPARVQIRVVSASDRPCPRRKLLSLLMRE